MCRKGTLKSRRQILKNIFLLKGSNSLMSLAISSDGEGRSGSGETQARPKATGPMTEKYSLFLYLNEKLLIGRKVAGATLKS